MGIRQAVAAQADNVEAPVQFADMERHQRALVDQLTIGDSHGVVISANLLLELGLDETTKGIALGDAVRSVVQQESLVRPLQFTALESLYRLIVRNDRLGEIATRDALRPGNGAPGFTTAFCRAQPVVAAAAILALATALDEAEGIRWIRATFEDPHVIVTSLVGLGHPETYAMASFVAQMLNCWELAPPAGGQAALPPPAAWVVPLGRCVPADARLAPTQFRYDDARRRVSLGESIARGYRCSTWRETLHILASPGSEELIAADLRAQFLAGVSEHGFVLSPRSSPALEMFFSGVLDTGRLSLQGKAWVLSPPPPGLLRHKPADENDHREFQHQPVLAVVAALVVSSRHESFERRILAIRDLGYSMANAQLDPSNPHAISLMRAMTEALERGEGPEGPR